MAVLGAMWAHLLTHCLLPFFSRLGDMALPALLLAGNALQMVHFRRLEKPKENEFILEL